MVIQRCGSCGYYNHPPRRFCDACLGQDLRFEPVSGRGVVYTFTVMHQHDVAGFEEDAPFINIVVELAEQPAAFDGIQSADCGARQSEDRRGGRG